MCKNGNTEFGVITLLGRRLIGYASTYPEAKKIQDASARITRIEESKTDCGECIHCSTYCDVCASWYHDEEPCELH